MAGSVSPDKFAEEMQKMQDSMREESLATMRAKTDLAIIDMHQDVHATAINLTFKEAGRVHIDA
jgi:hypothetical protein